MDWTALKTKTPPTAEPVTTAELREFLRLTDSSQDDLLAGLITAARASLEVYLRRTLISTTYQLYFDRFPEVIRLARAPFQSVVSITYADAGGVAQTLATSSYTAELDSLTGRIAPAYGTSWPSTRPQPNAVCVEYKAGYGDLAASVPKALAIAIKMLAADLYEHPEANGEARLEESRSLKFLLQAYQIAEA